MTDNKNVTKVLCGVMTLSDEEKNILVSEVQDFLKSDILDQKSKKRAVEDKVKAYGDDEPCPCCGKA